jgi:hypothetical protein
LCDQFPKLIDLIGNETIQPAAADGFHMLVATITEGRSDCNA